MSSYRTIVTQFDWREYIEAHFQYKGTDNPDQLRVCCPSCLENDYKCYVHIEKKVWWCHKCEFSTRSADVFDFVAKTESISRYQATLKLFHQYKDYTPDYMGDLFSDAPAAPAKAPLKLAVLPPCTHTIYQGSLVRDGAAPYLAYLLARGLTEKEVKAISTMFCIKSPIGEDDISKRVVWPVYSGDGLLVSWLSRDITDKHPTKYKNAKNSDISKALWPNVTPKTAMAVLVEGLLDALAMRRLGYDVYCTFGKKVSEAQVLLLQEYGIKEIVLFWDKKDAKKQMQAAVEFLSSRFNTCVADLREWPADKDCGDFLKDQTLEPKIVTAIQNAIHPDSVDYIDWVMN